MFLPNLTSLAVTDIDMNIITNMSIFCPELTYLDISDSEVRLTVLVLETLTANDNASPLISSR